MAERSSAASYDLVVVGANAGGFSAATAGLGRVKVLEPGSTIPFGSIVGPEALDISFGETVTSVDVDGEGLVVTTAKGTYGCRVCLVAQRLDSAGWEPPIPVAARDRVHVDRLPDRVADADVLVVGHTDHAVELASRAVEGGANAVLAAGGMDPTLVSPTAAEALRVLEKGRRLTGLFRSVPEQVGEVDGYPMAFFGDRRTPDLQFDHVVFASGRTTVGPDALGVTDAALASGQVWFLGEEEVAPGAPTSPGWRVASDIAAACFPDREVAPSPSPAERRRGVPGVAEELRDEHYNATITHFEPTHSDLWILRVRPDEGTVSHLPGQYASLGLGYWEERIDDALDPGLDGRWDKLVRRSYSISNRMLEPNGYLVGERGEDELEFYIVLVPPTEGNVPGLTPRLALKRAGDRIYLGPKVAGRYTLAPVDDPDLSVLFLSTGTGEAPHNNMLVELLRKGHRGPIASAVSVRRWADLAYIDKHRYLEERYPWYSYLPLPTREDDVPKRYIQDTITDGTLEGLLGHDLDPARTHVFLCGNPSMIGLPEEVDGETRYPDTTGVVELLADRGFTLDQRKQRGNVHFEEYW